MMLFRAASFVSAAAVLAACAHARHATSWVSYTPGLGVAAGYTDPDRALGEPSRFTPGPFGGAVTPFASAFDSTQLVQVGRGGSLVVAFDQPITNDAANPFGIDFIVFGNAFLLDAAYPSGIAQGGISAEGGDIDVSADGVHWVRVASNAADGLFPTLGYADLTDPYSPTPGSVLTDFTRPVDPALTITPGMTFAQIVAAYNGSGGGFGVDIAASGLPAVNFVRITVAEDAAMIPEIDGFAVVPAPGALIVLGLAAAGRGRRR